MSSQVDLKLAAAYAAIGELRPGAIVGVGSGSTVETFVEELASRRVPCPGAVCASRCSEEKVRQLGIAVLA